MSDFTTRDGCFEAFLEQKKRNDAAQEAWGLMRDSILNERDSLAESNLTSDQINDVLGVVDDHCPFIS